MDWLSFNLPYYCVVPMLLYYYYCRLCDRPYVWYGGVVYTTLAFGLSVLEAIFFLTGFFFVLVEIFLLAIFGIALMKQKPAKALAVSSLVISAFSIITGITQSLTYWIVANLRAEYVTILKHIEIAYNVITAMILLCTLRFILRVFGSSIKGNYHFVLPALAIPVLFIALVERTISVSLYGNVVIWDDAEGLVAPMVNNTELLVLRVFAFAGLFSALIVYQKLTVSIRNEQRTQIFEQQAQDKETYVREAEFRYTQTQSFRHDIKNHLLVLRQLLKEGKPEDASAYLTNLEQVSAALSFPVNTGHTAADALLGSKLAAARQQGIDIDCSLTIPRKSGVKDIDWCILLANALDNAIKASVQADAGDPFIHISGMMKGNFYLLCVKNCCKSKTALPAEGIGLSNIRAVAQKYGGKADVKIENETFILSVLLIISQQ